MRNSAIVPAFMSVIMFLVVNEGYFRRGMRYLSKFPEVLTHIFKIYSNIFKIS